MVLGPISLSSAQAYILSPPFWDCFFCAASGRARASCSCVRSAETEAVGEVRRAPEAPGARVAAGVRSAPPPHPASVSSTSRFGRAESVELRWEKQPSWQ